VADGGELGVGGAVEGEDETGAVGGGAAVGEPGGPVAEEGVVGVGEAGVGGGDGEEEGGGVDGPGVGVGAGAGDGKGEGGDVGVRREVKIVVVEAGTGEGDGGLQEGSLELSEGGPGLERGGSVFGLDAPSNKGDVVGEAMFPVEGTEVADVFL
jgi:hypothetical protein